MKDDFKKWHREFWIIVVSAILATPVLVGLIFLILNNTVK